MHAMSSALRRHRGADVVHVTARCITPRIVERLHRLGKVVHGNDAIDMDDVQRVLSAGADRLSTNEVATAVVTCAQHSVGR